MLAIMSENQQTMTLKEITDLLKVRHNDAMETVARMAESHEFGEVRKIRSSYKNNIGADLPIETYALNQRQSIAVSARLNTALLMRVIDRWQELEANQASTIPQTFSQALLLAGKLQAEKEELEKQMLLDAPSVTFAKVVQESSNTRFVRVWVKAMKHENNLRVGEREVFKWLVENKYIFKSKEDNSYYPYAKYEANNKNYFTITLDNINGKTIKALKITGVGVVALTAKVVEHFRV